MWVGMFGGFRISLTLGSKKDISFLDFPVTFIYWGILLLHVFWFEFGTMFGKNNK